MPDLYHLFPFHMPATQADSIVSSSKLLTFHDPIVELARLRVGWAEGVCTREMSGDVNGERISVQFPGAETLKI